MTDKFPFEHFFQGGPKESPTSKKDNNNNYLVDNFLKSETASSTKKADLSTSKAWNTNELYFLNQEVLKVLKSYLNPEKFNALFQENLKLINITENQALFQVPSAFVREMIESQYKNQISESIRQTLGKEYEIIVKTENSTQIKDKSLNSPTANLSDFLEKTPSKSTTQSNSCKKAGEARFTLDLNLNQTKDDLISTVESQYIEHVQEFGNNSISIDPYKTFDNFIVGPSNNLAFATAHAVAESPGKDGKYPCLYIYSDSGLGKTHLLHAVANGILKNYPEKAICLISAREFMKELINAFRDKKLSEFQKKYCENIDVLMIDDIHELKNKQSTQEEFFHIFNELHSRGKQLIFTSDKAPKEIDGIEERIITRLQWGLVIDIQKPDLETRIAILKKKALEIDLFVPDDVLNLIASSIKTSIRELEGSLIKLSASADVMDMEIDIEMARELLKLTPSEEMHSITIENIAKSVSQYYKIPLADLKSKSRNKDIVKARHIAWYLSKKLIDATLKDIAKYYGGRDHSSVIHGINKITEQVKKDPSISKDLVYLENNI